VSECGIDGAMEQKCKRVVRFTGCKEKQIVNLSSGEIITRQRLWCCVVWCKSDKIDATIRQPNERLHTDG
jgi:hypothetical protein